MTYQTDDQGNPVSCVLPDTADSRDWRIGARTTDGGAVIAYGSPFFGSAAAAVAGIEAGWAPVLHHGIVRILDGRTGDLVR